MKLELPDCRICGAGRTGALATLVAATLGGSPLVADASESAINAQQAPSSAASEGVSSDSLAEILVTAQFRSQSLQDTPIAITAITGDQLLEQGITDVTGLTQIAPNVNLHSSGAYGGNVVTAYIRGIGGGSFVSALEPGVAFYVDDVYLGTAQATLLNLIDLERAEVLRGPQGTLSGKNGLDPLSWTPR